mmetsp:Transcript_87224/g.136534  ORF Transcript_87224/g.136534 Transcript_87224/m.136534 type:complete len:523 (-) Transcript_87224:370-1938(-)
MVVALPFWEHLESISEAHRALEQEVNDLKFENSTLRKALYDIDDLAANEHAAVRKVNFSAPSKSFHDGNGLATHTPSTFTFARLPRELAPPLTAINPEPEKISDTSGSWSVNTYDVILEPAFGHTESRGFNSSYTVCGVVDVIQRWERLVTVVISTFGRARFWPLSCWSPDLHEHQNRKNMVRIVGSMLDAKMRNSDHFVSGWYDANDVRVPGILRRQDAWLFRASQTSFLTVMGIASHKSTKKKRKKKSCSVRDSCGILHPLSKRQISWNFVGALCVLYDIIMLSLQVFDFKASGTTRAIEWGCRCFWFLDIPLTFRTGFYVKATYEDGCLPIAKRYATTWLTADLLALIPDTVFEIFDSHEEGNRAHLVKWLQLVRVIRLVRIAKYVVILNTILRSLNSRTASLVFHMMKYLVLMVGWVHFCGCAWFAIAKGAEDSWLVSNGFESLGLPQIYFLSIQFAVAQLQGSTDITPAFNSKERGFQVVVVLLSIFIMAIFLSFATNVVIALQKARDKKASFENRP